jgi:aldose 1-epimerase
MHKISGRTVLHLTNDLTHAKFARTMLFEKEIENMSHFSTFRIENQKACTSALIGEIGAAILELHIPDRNGIEQDVVLGYADRSLYLTNPHHFGIAVGRYANRISDGKFELAGKVWQLDRNNEYGDCIHGGSAGFHVQKFTLREHSSNAVTLQLQMPDGAAGFPGNLTLQITYTLTDNGAFVLEYRAVTDKPTVLNLTNHTYFNLEGTGSSSILDHQVQIHSDRIVETDGVRNIPTGNWLTAHGQVFDLRQPVPLRDHLSPLHEKLQPYMGFDFNYAVRQDLSEVARAYAPATGITLSIASTEPALGFYTGNWLTGAYQGKGGIYYPRHAGLCFESQHFPDSPNRPEFPSTALFPGEEYYQKTIWQFSCR